VDEQESTVIEETNRLTKILDTIWQGVILGKSGWNPDKSCFDLADNYRASDKTPEENAKNFINWQTAKAGMTGFALGIPGGPWALAAIPADFVSVSYLQLRMVAVIGLLFGWDVRSDQMRIVAYSALLGVGAGEAVRDVGVKAATGWGKIWIKKIPMSVIDKLNKFLPGRFIIKGLRGAGAKTAAKYGLNLAKIVPLLGGIVGGGVNVLVTQQIGSRAIRALKDGPPSLKVANKAEPIDGAAEIVSTFVANLPEDIELSPVPGDAVEKGKSEATD
jgi:uncharacterized protein (DUF697 family)